MRTILGPSLFIAQFIGTEPEFITLEGVARWAASLGFKALQIPTASPAIFDVVSQAYCDDIRAVLDRHGLVVSDLASRRQGHLMAVHPAYDRVVAGFAPANTRDRQAWAASQLRPVRPRLGG